MPEELHNDLDIVEFLKSVPKDMEPGKQYQWVCPVCDGTVNGSLAEGNGHIRAHCENCGMGIVR